MLQGGGCASVGVTGLVQSGGFCSMSKGFGTAAAGLLETDMVTADGVTRTANPCTPPELFWAIKGGTAEAGGREVECGVSIARRTVCGILRQQSVQSALGRIGEYSAGQHA